MASISVLPTSLEELARAKWRASGLTDEDAKRLGFEILSGESVKELGANFKASGGIKLPYWNADGSRSTFFRIRYLEFGGFTAQLEKPQRYAQPTGSLNEVYLPPLFKISWADILANSKLPIYITEGEFKSACACSVGLACIGLGGVDVWRSAKRGLDFLPVLVDVNWSGRDVVIAFDSDAATNLNVVRAQLRLSQELLARGALPRIASLPSLKDGSKQGLDDFIVANGKDALEAILEDAPALPEAQALWELNSEIVYVKNPGIIVVRESGQKLSPSNFSQHAYSNRHYIETVVTKKGVQTQKKPLAKRWLEWEQRFALNRITYSPGEGQVTKAGEWNTWKGWGCDPQPGDVSPWHRLLDYVFKENTEARKWFERWCAYPLQHPGTKLFSSVIVWSVWQGTGKTLLGYTLRNIYGDNAAEIKDKDLHSGFNEWAENKQFIIGDEITSRSGKLDEADRIKGLITQEQIRINAKYLPSYVVPDCVNYYCTSNHPDALFLEDSDRRFFIHEIVGLPGPLQMYHEYDRWVHGNGPSYLFDYLLKLDLGDFHPKTPALVTSAKRAMIVDNKSDLGMWCLELKEDPSHALQPLGASKSLECDVFNVQQLLKCYDPESSTIVTANGLARELKRNGFRQVNDGSPIRTCVGLQRLYVVRNADKWLRAQPHECAAHWNEHFGPDSRKY